MILVMVLLDTRWRALELEPPNARLVGGSERAHLNVGKGS